MNAAHGAVQAPGKGPEQSDIRVVEIALVAAEHGQGTDPAPIAPQGHRKLAPVPKGKRLYRVCQSPRRLSGIDTVGRGKHDARAGLENGHLRAQQRHRCPYDPALFRPDFGIDVLRGPIRRR